MQHLSDEQLVVLVLQGQSQAFEILVERYQKQVFALAYRLGGDYDEAKDMAQEAFVRIYQNLISLCDFFKTNNTLLRVVIYVRVPDSCLFAISGFDFCRIAVRRYSEDFV